MNISQMEVNRRMQRKTHTELSVCQTRKRNSELAVLSRFILLNMKF